MCRINLVGLFLFCNMMPCWGHSTKVLLISMDGFRWDYLNRVDTPNFDRIAREGVKSPRGLMPTFITKTFPCHYTMVTGLYEESHGIIGNRMYDPVLNASFSPRTKDTEWWDAGEPLWITAKLNGLKSATYFWPGSDVVIKYLRPDIWMPFNNAVPFKERVDSVVDWFKDKGINFATIYFNEPDLTGHTYGPESSEVNDKIKYMDSIAGYILDKLEGVNLLEEVNVIITSDHGMTEIDVVNRVIDLEDYVAGDQFRLIESGPIGNLLPSDGKTRQVYEALRGKHPNMTVYLKKDIPIHYHYRNNRRVMPILVVPDEGWTITKGKAPLKKDYGNHGFDNKYPSMHPIFLARGPGFKKNFKSEMFESVNLYPLICNLLHIPAAPNNGSLENVKALLMDSSTSGHRPVVDRVPLLLLPLITYLFMQCIAD